MADVFVHHCRDRPCHWAGVWILMAALAGPNAFGAVDERDVYDPLQHVGDNTYPSAGELTQFWSNAWIAVTAYTHSHTTGTFRYFTFGSYITSYGVAAGSWFEVDQTTFNAVANAPPYYGYLPRPFNPSRPFNWSQSYHPGDDAAVPNASSFTLIHPHVDTLPPPAQSQAEGPRLQIPSSTYAVSPAIAGFIRGIYLLAGKYLGYALIGWGVIVVMQSVNNWFRRSLANNEKGYARYAEEIAMKRERIRDEAEAINSHHGEIDTYGNRYDASRDRLV